MDLTPVSESLVVDDDLSVRDIEVTCMSKSHRKGVYIEEIVNHPQRIFKDLSRFDVLVVVFVGEMEFVNEYFRSKVIEARHDRSIAFGDLTNLDRSIEPFYGLVFRRVARNVKMKCLTTPFIPRYTFDLRILHCCSACLHVFTCCPLLVCGTCELALCMGCAPKYSGRRCSCREQLPIVKQFHYGEHGWTEAQNNNVQMYDAPQVITPKTYALDSRTLSFGRA